MGRYQAQTGRPLTVNQLARESGITRSVVMSAAKGEARRVDMKTLNTLLEFFSQELETVTVADLLEYVPDEKTDR